MENGEEGKNEQRRQLDRQHLAEWNAQLAQEMQNRTALEEQFRRDHKRSYLAAINVYDRAQLEANQRQAINELVHQSRRARVQMLKRQTQEKNALT